MNQTSIRPSYRTEFPKREELRWLLIDVAGKPVGRVATRIARILLGKDVPSYSPQWDGGERVVIINVDKIMFTGNKAAQKTYYKYSGWVGGLKETKASDLLENNPEAILKSAVKGMLPKNALGRNLLKNMKVFQGEEHDHVAQKPTKVEV